MKGIKQKLGIIVGINLWIALVAWICNIEFNATSIWVHCIVTIVLLIMMQIIDKE